MPSWQLGEPVAARARPHGHPDAILISAGAAAAAVALFAALHRTGRGPLLQERTRGTAMVTVVGTTFAVTLAFVIFASYQTYSRAQTGAGSEAVAVLDMARTRSALPARPAPPPARRAHLLGPRRYPSRMARHAHRPLKARRWITGSPPTGTCSTCSASTRRANNSPSSNSSPTPASAPADVNSASPTPAPDSPPRYGSCSYSAAR